MHGQEDNRIGNLILGTHAYAAHCLQFYMYIHTRTISYSPVALRAKTQKETKKDNCDDSNCHDASENAHGLFL